MEPNLSVVFPDDQSMTFHSPEVMWNISDEAPHLLEAASEHEPALPPICARLAETLPCQRVWGFGEAGAYVHPDRHARAIYLRLAEIPDVPSGGGCIAFKGGEVMCENFDAMVHRLKNMWNILACNFGDTSRASFDEWGMMSALDRFPIGEGKPPGVVSLHDATEEIDLAVQVQKAHFDRYGELARLPLPLFGYAWPSDVSERIWQKLKPHLSPAALPAVEAQLSDGLGTYVYFYPSLSSRVEHLQVPDVGHGVTFSERIEELSKSLDPRQVITRWLELTARLLALGYVPATATNVGRGYCVMAQNAVMDGGFVDLGGLRHVDLFQNESDLAFAISRTLQVLGHTVSRFLAGSFADSDVFTRRVPGPFSLVWEGVRQQVLAEIASGASVPPSIRRFMEKNTPGDDLVNMFSQLFSFDTYRSEDVEQEQFRLLD